ncbi:unnamed protein product [Oikopleura dioica]|uniref:RRM domain-containing protein n=2 Tax=Oikopleura dioica TaxID=34765 RepID=E4YMU3_OIKDI|nr:unnamed protein product [Oikopleura dioica]
MKTDVKVDISSTASMSLNSAGSDDGSEPAVQHPMNPRVEAKIKALCQRTGLVMKQENGQRKYTNPALTGKPEKGTEIFIGKLPRDLFEDELYPVLESYGPAFELRMMLDFNGNNRGFCFVTYQTRNESHAALKGINNLEIRKGRLLGACQSVDNCRLFVGGIPKSKKRDEIMEEMKKVTEGVVDVIVYPSAADKSKNRGFSFVEYKDHKAAAMARRKLMPGRIQLWGHQIAVDWAEPEIEVEESVMETVKILYVRNLMLHTSEDTLEAAFAKVTGKGTIERVKKIRDYAFVHFNTRDNALKAMKELNNGMIDGALVEVVLAKPVDRDSYVRHSRASERKVIQAPQMPMLLAYGDTAAQSLAAAQAQNVYAGAPMYYQMYQPAMMQEGRQSALRKPRGAGGTRPLGGRTYIGQPMRASEKYGKSTATPLIPTPTQISSATLNRSKAHMQVLPIQRQRNLNSFQLLEEICKLNSLGSPVYQLHSCQVGAKVLYLCHITLANGSTLNQMVTRSGCRWSSTPEEAQSLAAEGILALLGIQVAHDYE